MIACSSEYSRTWDSSIVMERPSNGTSIFAWLLRLEAYKRFLFDPDGVFSPSDLPSTKLKPPTGTNASKLEHAGTAAARRLT